MNNTGIYIHIPYCRRKCLYCDFYSEGAARADWHRYVSALLNELRFRSDISIPAEGPFTFYIGGGTPSLLPCDEMARLAECVFSITGRLPDEFTIEVNPDDVDAGKAKAWSDCGINRVSMGVQSLVDKELKAIGRRHDSESARRAFDTLRGKFDNISLDIIFGLPYQTLETLNLTLDGILDMNPEHVSAYSLMYEERTALTRLRDEGRLQETDEDVSVSMFRDVTHRLADAGFEQYELSNYARPGFRSRHNSAYWQGFPYIGLGAGAHGYDGARTRTHCMPDAALYTRLWTDKGADTSCLYDKEVLTDNELREEMIMTRLRTREGLDMDDYGRKFGARALTELTAAALPLMDTGMLQIQGRNIALTRDGIMVSDDIIATLF